MRSAVAIQVHTQGACPARRRRLYCPAGHRSARAHLSSMHPALTPRATAACLISRLPLRLPSASRHLSPAIWSQPARAPLVRGLFPPGGDLCPGGTQAPATAARVVKGVGRGGGQGGPQCGPRSRGRRPRRRGQAAGGRMSAAAMSLGPTGMHFARRADLREPRLWPRLCTLPCRSSALRRRFPAVLPRCSTAPDIALSAPLTARIAQFPAHTHRSPPFQTDSRSRHING